MASPVEKADLAGTSGEPDQVAKVAFRAPPIWKSNVELWFLQVESMFHNAGITTESSKFHCVVSSLDVDLMAVVCDIVRSPPEKAYTAIKKRIVEQFAQSETLKLQNLLLDIPLGDKSPSLLLREMRELALGRIPDPVLRNLWLRRLPTHHQQILSVSGDDLDKLAELACKISEVTEFATVTEVKAAVPQSDLAKQVSDLAAQVQHLTTLMERHCGQTQGNFRSRRESNSGFKPRNPESNPGLRSRSRSRSRELCWYHFTFKDKASKCVAPCKWAENCKAQPS